MGSEMCIRDRYGDDEFDALDGLASNQDARPLGIKYEVLYRDSRVFY